MCYTPTAPDADDPDEGDDGAQLRAQRRGEVFGLGLVASDASYPIWLSQQEAVRWPWEFAESPQTAARHFTRELWFWSRQVAALRGAPGWAMPELPDEWEPCAAPLGTGTVPALDVSQGLLTLAQVLAAGTVVPPWNLDLTPADFADTFNMNMGYVDAYRLWLMSAFDDRPHMRRCVGPDVPPEWETWLAQQFHYT